MVPDGSFRLGLELMIYLDGNLSSNGLDDPALGIELFQLPWWTRPTPPADNVLPYLSSATLKSALNFYHEQLAAAEIIPFTVPHSLRIPAYELNKPAYTWHSSANDNLPNTPTCTRCRLYRSVGLGLMDHIRDTYNAVHACEMANQAEKDIAIRRASGFNELFEAALKKESNEVVVETGQQSEERPAVEALKTLIKSLARAMPKGKWTWGADLTDEDLRDLIRGADRPLEAIHSGYDRDLTTSELQSATSDPVSLEDPSDHDLRFESPSESIILIPELLPHEIPAYSPSLLNLPELAIDSEPDPVIEAFLKRAKAEVTKANKSLMLDEVDQPASYFDFKSEFVPRTALIPRRPWLAPILPLVLPPNNQLHVNTEPIKSTGPGSASELTDHMSIPDSDEIPDHIDIYESDNDPNELVNADSDSSSSERMTFPASDDKPSDAMDVVETSPAGKMAISADSDSDSIPDHISLSSESSKGMTESVDHLVGVNRDVKTGKFTAKSFAHLPDDFLD